jgi:alpha-L-rhamnosidase
MTDVYIANGSGTEVYTPITTYHGYRYVQIENLPSGYTPTNGTLTSHFVHSDAARVGHVEFKNESLEILNKIQTAILYTQQSNFHTIPTDCCQRER